MRLLIIEDDKRTAQYLIRGLTESGHVADWIADAATGDTVAREGVHDVLIVDRRLHNADGIDLVRRLRADGFGVPILMLSAAGGAHERADGLRAGCDDYLAKPYAFAELIARLEALDRRAGRRYSETLSVGDLTYQPGNLTVRRQGKVIELQSREAKLVEMLLRNAHCVVTRTMLLESAWDYAFEPRGNIVDMHIHRLRRKIDDGFEIPLIRTVPGAGYMMTDRETPSAA